VRQAECHDKLEKLLVPFFLPIFCFYLFLSFAYAHTWRAVPRMCACLPFVVRFFWGGGHMCFLGRGYASSMYGRTSALRDKTNSFFFFLVYY
jgi:hypothetical protein